MVLLVAIEHKRELLSLAEKESHRHSQQVTAKAMIKQILPLLVAVVSNLIFLSPVESFGVHPLSPLLENPWVAPSTVLSMGSYAWLDGAKQLDYTSDVFKDSAWKPGPGCDWLVLPEYILKEDLDIFRTSCSCFRRALQELGGEARFPCLIVGLAFESSWVIDAETCASALKEIEDFKNTTDTIGRIPVLLTEYDHRRVTMGVETSEEFGIHFGMELGENSDLYEFVFKEAESGKILFRSKKFVLEKMPLYTSQTQRILFRSKKFVLEYLPLCNSQTQRAVWRFRDEDNGEIFQQAVVWRFRDEDNGEILNVPIGVISLYPFYFARAFEVDSSAVNASDFDNFLDELIRSLKDSVVEGKPVEIYWPICKL